MLKLTLRFILGFFQKVKIKRRKELRFLFVLE